VAVSEKQPVDILVIEALLPPPKRGFRNLLWPEEPLEIEPLQFRLWHLLLLQAVVAIILGILVAGKIWGALYLWLAMIVLLAIPATGVHRRWKRLAVDLAVGVVMPAVCIAFDPLVFEVVGELLGSSISATALLAITGQMIAMLAWQVVRHRPSRLSGLFAGFLFAGAALAGTIGLIMLPLTLIGLLGLIGILGLTPLLTAYVFWRNAVLAFRQARSRLPGMATLAMFAAGAILAVAVPSALGLMVGDSLLDLLIQLRQPLSIVTD
jgi:hypothetical protein